MPFSSIGMVSSRRLPTGLTEVLCEPGNPELLIHFDAGANLNQCPIVKGDSFLYTFDSTDQAGTFWYHSHLCTNFLTSSLHVLEKIIMIPLATQYCDGLRGPFIIY